MQTQWICGRCLSSILRRHKNGRFLPAAIRRYAQSTRPIPEDHAVKTRNIGIIAHIDAGKTTTTERMLYYSGFTRRLGDVDEGSTVTDFLPAERARGITIQSAAISFMWPPVSPDATTPSNGPNTLRSSTPHNINLIDTPGHADFTFEVLRSLRVLDGAVCILDGVAGVEAQTDKVWAQAAAHQIPRIIFINKLDRDGAAFGRTIKEIAARLAVWPAVCGIPWWSEDGKLNGIGDVINLRGLRYPSGGDGKQIDLFDWTRLQAEAPILAAELKKARIALIELLSEHDDRMVEHYLDADEDHTAISSNDIVDSLRRCVMTSPQMLVPVFAGASFRNIGVQPLLDAVVDLLPSPTDRPDPEISLGSQTRASLSRFLKGEVNIGKDVATHPSKSLSKSRASLALKPIESCALAFKVVADAKRGVLVYVRVYSGVINRMAPIWNTNLQTAERAQRLMKMYANDAVDIDAIPAGQIGVIPGLKLTRTGDTLVAYGGGNLKHGPPSPVNQMQLRPIDVPPPVFFVSVEPNSTSEEKHIKESLGLLLREDPSLHVSIDEESGQTHLAGMGELHLEIARDRLVQDLKAKARIGKIEIGYRETLVDKSSEVTELFERNIGGKASKAACTAKVSPIEEGVRSGEDSDHNFELPDNNRLSIFTRGLDSDGSSTTPDGPSLPDHLDLPAVLLALQNGTNAALARGPVHGYPMHSTNIRLIFDIEQHMFPSTTASSLASAARRAVSGALKDSVTMQPSIMMEPVMQVTISVDEDSLGAVVHDISSARGGNVVRLDAEEETSSSRMALTPAHIERIYAPPDPFAGGIAANSLAKSAAGGNMRQIIARVPLKEMVGYLKHLRSLTAGRGTFTMVIDQFERMTSQRQKIVLNELRGDFD